MQFPYLDFFIQSMIIIYVNPNVNEIINLLQSSADHMHLYICI